MIVNYTSDGWEIISQRAHGLVAAAVANEWKHAVRSERWIETLIAVAEHDDAQVELERTDLLTDQGGPMDFSMRKMQYDHCLCSITQAYNKSLYIALLCSTHLDFLCAGSNSEDNKVKRLMKEQQQKRQQWMKLLGISPKELERDYRLLEWCDALSLLLCQNKAQPEERAVEISTGPDGKIYQLYQLENGSLTVSPWPFQNNKFQLSCEFRSISQLAFKDPEDFKKSYQATLPEFKRWFFEKTKSV